MNIGNTAAWIAACSLLLAGCGEISYKRGASGAELQDAQTACKSAASREAYESCMDERGWTIARLDELNPVATIAYTPDSRSPVAAASAAPAPDIPAVPATGAAQPAAPDPMDIYVISSWWKIGGSPQALKKDIDACVAELGEAHRPPADRRQATRGLLLCLRKQGWYGLQEKTK